MRWNDRHYRPTLEQLEKRDLPATAVLSGGYLYITSRVHDDTIAVSQNGDSLSIANTAIQVGKFSDATVSTTQVKEIVIYAYGGGDLINLRPSAATTVNVSSYIYADGGYNDVFGGAGTNYMQADSAGHNTFNGYTGLNYLAAGSTTDVLNAGSGFTWYYRPINPSYAFVDGEHVSDVKQGFSPSCQTDAALAEAVQQGFNFADSIHYLGNYTYDVSLYGGSVHERVSFNGWYNDQDPMPTTSGEFWTILMYRARLQYLGINPTAEYTNAQWDSLNRSTGGALYSIPDSLYAFTGRPAQFMSMASVSPNSLESEMGAGDYIVASSVAGGGTTTLGIVRDHAYALLRVYYQGGMWKVELYNPWGFDSTNGMTIESLAGGKPTNLGFITLSWSQFISSAEFQGISVATR